MGDRFSTKRIWLSVLIAAGLALFQATGRTQYRAGQAHPPGLAKSPVSQPDVRADEEGLRRLSAQLKHFRSIGDQANAAKIFAKMFSLEVVPDPAAAIKIFASARSNRVEGVPGNIKDTGFAEGTVPVFFSPDDEKNPSLETWNSSQGNWALFSAAEQWSGGRPGDIRVRKSSDHGRTWAETMALGDGRPWTHPSLRQVSDQTIGMTFVRDWDGEDGDVFFARLSEDLAADAEFPVAVSQASQRNPSLATDFRSYPAPYVYVVYTESEGLTRSVKFRVSPDLGITWSRAVTIGSFAGPDGPNIETAVAYDPDRDTLHVAFTWPQGFTSGIAVASSTTSGASWSAPVFITPEDDGPDSSPKIAARKSMVLVVYEHGAADGGADIGLARSSDSGRSWVRGGSLASTAAAERFPDIRATDGTGTPRFVASFVEAGSRVHLLTREAAGIGTWTTERTLEASSGPIESGPVVITTMPASDDNGSAGVLWAQRSLDYDILFGSSRLLALADLIVTPQDRVVPCTAGTTTFDVDKEGWGRVDWTAAVVTGESWLTIQSGSSGENSGTIVAAYEQNPALDARIGSIRVTPSDDSITAVTVTVTQVGAPGLDVTPTDGLTATGPEGGPFAPASKDYALQNIGGTAVSWTAAANETWFSASPASGTLDPGASTTVTVSYTAAADSLNTGIYDGTMTFTNTTDGNGDTTRPVTLTVSAPPGVLTVTPAGGLVSAGLTGGPFAPSSRTYTLENSGDSTLSWTASKTQSWTSLSATSGSLVSGATTTVTVSIDAAADILAAGTYNDTVSFTNTTDGNGDTTRPVTLTVSAPPGVLTVTPAGGLVSAGLAGGPFAPSNRTYTLENSGDSTLSWTASKTQSWTSLSATSGSLVSGATTTVTVSINAAADALAAGTYNDTVSFTNATSGNGDTTRSVTLSVDLSPALSVTPASRNVPFSAGTTTFDVSNTGAGVMNWTASVIAGSDWLSIESGAGGTDSGTVTAFFAVNRTGASRVGIIRVTAPGASGSPRDVTVLQVKGSLVLTLSGQRLVEKAWIIQKEYGRLAVTIENPASVPVETYLVYRRAGSADEQLVRQVDGASVESSFVVNDTFLEPGTSYTYRIVAIDALGGILGQSNEITI